VDHSSLTRDLLIRRFDLGSINTALTAAPDRVSDPQQSRSVRFDIPLGTLSAVIVAFETATGIKVTASIDSILTIHSPGRLRSAAGNKRSGSCSTERASSIDLPRRTR
jgi:hypothetical protein